MARQSLVCWKCGAGLDEVPQPLSRYAECLDCRTELHVCRMCRFYDPAVAQACREPIAEEVKDKTRANFCGYFEPRPGAYAGPAGPSKADAALAALFGDADANAADDAGAEDDAMRDLNALFTDPEEPRN